MASVDWFSVVYSSDLFETFFFFKQMTAYELRISDWSSDVCSSDLIVSRMARAVASLGRAILRILAGRLRGSVEVRHPQIVKAGDAFRLDPHANPARAGEGPIFNLEQLALAEIDIEQRLDRTSVE